MYPSFAGNFREEPPWLTLPIQTLRLCAQEHFCLQYNVRVAPQGIPHLAHARILSCFCVLPAGGPQHA